MRAPSDIHAEQRTQQLGKSAAGKAHQSRTHIGMCVSRRYDPPTAGSCCPVAALNLTTSSAGTRRRSFVLMPCALAPLADLGGVQPGRRCPAAAPGWLPGTASGPPCSPDIARQRIPQRLGMLGGQVDLIFGAIQPGPTVPSASLPSRSSSNRVCILWATGGPFLTWLHHQPGSARAHERSCLEVL